MRKQLHAGIVPVAPPHAADEYAVKWKLINTAVMLDPRTLLAHGAVVKDNLATLRDYIVLCHRLFKDQKGAAPPAPATDMADPDAAAIATLIQAGSAAAPDPGMIKLEAELPPFLTAVTETTGKMSLEERLTKVDPLAWWAQRAAQFPLLAHVSSSILCVQASSAASERLFSASGSTASLQRSSLSPDMLEVCNMVQSAARNGIDVRAEVAEELQLKMLDANAKRSAAKKEAVAAAGGGGEDMDEEEVEEDDGGMEARADGYDDVEEEEPEEE